MSFVDPKDTNRQTHAHNKLHPGTIKDVHITDTNSSSVDKVYTSSFYDVYIKANNYEEEIYLQRVPADPKLPRLYKGQGVKVYYVEWNQKPRIVGATVAGKVEVVDITPVVTPIGWVQFHQEYRYQRAVNYTICGTVLENFKSKWAETVVPKEKTSKEIPIPGPHGYGDPEPQSYPEYDPENPQDIWTPADPLPEPATVEATSDLAERNGNTLYTVTPVAWEGNTYELTAPLQ
jgi:hypothetical protein